MLSYPLKKAEFEKALKTIKSQALLSYYERCLASTETCFETYKIFYNAFQAVLDIEINTASEIDNSINLAIKQLLDRQEITQELAEQSNNENPVISAFLNMDEHLVKLQKSEVRLAEIIQNQKDVAKNVYDGKSKLLSLILESTFDTLFIYIFRMAKGNCDRGAIKEFILFAVGAIPIVGTFTSGFAAIVNIAKAKSVSMSSADETINYLESYLQVSDIWNKITNGYVDMLEKWKEIEVERVKEALKN